METKKWSDIKGKGRSAEELARLDAEVEAEARAIMAKTEDEHRKRDPEE